MLQVQNHSTISNFIDFFSLITHSVIMLLPKVSTFKKQTQKLSDSTCPCLSDATTPFSLPQAVRGSRSWSDAAFLLIWDSLRVWVRVAGNLAFTAFILKAAFSGNSPFFLPCLWIKTLRISVAGGILCWSPNRRIQERSPISLLNDMKN